MRRKRTLAPYFFSHYIPLVIFGIFIYSLSALLDIAIVRTLGDLLDALLRANEELIRTLLGNLAILLLGSVIGVPAVHYVKKRSLLRHEQVHDEFLLRNALANAHTATNLLPLAKEFRDGLYMLFMHVGQTSLLIVFLLLSALLQGPVLMAISLLFGGGLTLATEILKAAVLRNTPRRARGLIIAFLRSIQKTIAQHKRHTGLIWMFQMLFIFFCAFLKMHALITFGQILALAGFSLIVHQKINDALKDIAIVPRLREIESEVAAYEKPALTPSDDILRIGQQKLTFADGKVTYLCIEDQAEITRGGLAFSSPHAHSAKQARMQLIQGAPLVFEGTLQENIHMARPTASQVELMRVIQDVGLWDKHNIWLGPDHPLPPASYAAFHLARALLRRPSTLIVDRVLQEEDVFLLPKLLSLASQGCAVLVLFSPSQDTLRKALEDPSFFPMEGGVPASPIADDLSSSASSPSIPLADQLAALPMPDPLATHPLPDQHA